MESNRAFFESCCDDDADLVASSDAKFSAKHYIEGHQDDREIKISRFISDSELNASLNKWLPKPGDPLAQKRVLLDHMFPDIAESLKDYGKGEWSLRPRTFAVLRMLGHPSLLDDFVKAGLSDSALPYTEGNLPDAVKGPELRSRFLNFQRLVLCKESEISELERGGRHLHLSSSGNNYFRTLKLLGQGRFGVVDHVISRASLLQFARKVVKKGSSSFTNAVASKKFENEMRIMKKLLHIHIVRFVGSYADQESFGIIMTPVADKNLRDYLESNTDEPHLRKRCLTRYFGCLAMALDYLHSKRVRHNDIKPENVLIRDDTVYLTDFGLSRTWEADERSTTCDDRRGFTSRYCAPEAVDSSPRGTESDIWSLGCVFLEMATVLVGYSLRDLYDFYSINGSHREDAFYGNSEATRLWIQKLTESNLGWDSKPFDWISNMLKDSVLERPTAAQLRARIVDANSANAYMCQRCLSPGAEWITVPPENKTGTNPITGTEDQSATIDKQRIPITASALGLAERTIQNPRSQSNGETVRDPPGSHETRRKQNGNEHYNLPDRSRATSRFSGLPEDRRPLPSAVEDSAVTEDTTFIRPEPVKPPPFLQKDSTPLPAATLLPSYILAGTNHFSNAEIEGANQPNSPTCNLFVYGRFMFPSVLHAIARISADGAYAPILGYRLTPSTSDWAKADLSIKRAAEIMTPARLKGYDRWRPRGLNCAVIQDARLTKRILLQIEAEGRGRASPEPPGDVTGFLVLGLRPVALKYCDLLLLSDRRTLRNMRPNEEGYQPSPLEDPLLVRQHVDVEVESMTGDIRPIQAETYVWSRGSHDLFDTWDEERFIRSSPFHSLLRTQTDWASEEQVLANTMKMSFALVGDYLVSAIMDDKIEDLAALLYKKLDPNAPCRLYGYPLQAAVAVGSEEMVNLLLAEGADVNAHGGQYGTALIAAAYCSRIGIMKKLIHNDADVFAEDKLHVDALYQAVAHGDYAITELLLEHGAWLCKNWREITDLAEQVKDKEVIKLLEMYDVRRIIREYQALQWHPRDVAPGREVASYAKITTAVIRKLVAVSSMSGNWKGRRGVAVTVAALKAGLSIESLSLMRQAINPIKAILRVVEQSDERHELASRRQFAETEHRSRSHSGRRLRPLITVSGEDTVDAAAVDHLQLRPSRPPPGFSYRRAQIRQEGDRSHQRRDSFLSPDKFDGQRLDVPLHRSRSTDTRPSRPQETSQASDRDHGRTRPRSETRRGQTRPQ